MGLDVGDQLPHERVLEERFTAGELEGKDRGVVGKGQVDGADHDVAVHRRHAGVGSGEAIGAGEVALLGDK